MKKLYSLLSAFVTVMFLSGCEVEPILNIPEDTFEIDNSGETAKLFFVVNGDWTVTSSESWCTVEPTEGNADGGDVSFVNVTCSKNESYDNRECIITVTSGDLSREVTVSQMMKAGIFVEKDVISISEKEQEVQLFVSSNVEIAVTVDSSAAKWITLEETKSIESESFFISVSANSSFEREGKVIVSQKYGHLQKEITIRQESGFVKFADTAFKEFCVYNFDMNRDREISVEEASLPVDMNCLTADFHSLKGIEMFTNLITLTCNGMSIDSLDLSRNVNLQTVNCNNNVNLKYINVSGLPYLKTLNAQYNSLETVVLDGCTNLATLNCGYGNLSSIDLSTLDKLWKLNLENNNLSSLDLSLNKRLYILDCSSNPIETLDLSNNTELYSLICKDTPLTVLDLSKNTAISTLECTSCPNLKVVYVSFKAPLLSLLYDRQHTTVVYLNSNEEG